MKTPRTGLLPVSGKKPKVLILGSFPGEVSIEKNQYYANKRNHFWKLLEITLNIDFDLSYERKTEAVRSSGIALWDVVYTCDRVKSMDGSIKNVVPNDIFGFIKSHNSIRAVFLNGITGAGRLFFRYHKNFSDVFPGIQVITLPSSSPANALYSFEEKAERWAVIRDYVR
ncbi:TDG/mug DNA glycosylase family protein [Methanomicrobium sp. W14]|uniref:DNA-deoxyinosine glycosylase n=1 Tax=Methanomicrobium sp. W14 TaxID=2817839 RepID=UPI001AE9E9F0|nr:DNA-deoxyinosine glycosylase [Methanomicrobium sp. W14]MBP2132673.1 TDG/mug DNA glycosylase family protein [Methanomicrobium sp. W14]